MRHSPEVSDASLSGLLSYLASQYNPSRGPRNTVRPHLKALATVWQSDEGPSPGIRPVSVF